MLWLEMSRDPKHGGTGWDFTRCLWSPTRKQRTNQRWAFWETVRNVQKDDQVLHLRGAGSTAAFVGFSSAETSGYETPEKPPEPGQWSYASSFYRVPLKDFTPFVSPIPLEEIFTYRDQELRDYFHRNREIETEHRRLFYVIQSNRLQCLNGAYLSELDDELAGIILGSDYSDWNSYNRLPSVDVRTSETLRTLSIRVGQKEFSDKVRSNYGHQCCFPSCTVFEDDYLTGAHIARWADVPELRGNVANGLCFCLMHDKAFEAGYFTLSEQFTIVINSDKVQSSNWATTNVLPFEGQQIRLGKVSPLDEALLHHWYRTSFY